MKRTIRDTHPEVFNDFHPTLNVGVNPDDLSAYQKTSVWWKCSIGHEYQVSVYTRVRTGCKECNRIKSEEAKGTQKNYAIKRGSISSREPQLLERWDYKKNKELKITPDGLTPSSKLDVYWRCEQGHSYKRSPKRERRATHCPTCYKENITEISSKQTRLARLDRSNTLDIAFPDVSKEWDYSKNKLTPSECTPFSNIKVWWICSFGHSWDATIDNRTRASSGCPQCRISSSRMEIFVYSELKFLFPDTKLKTKIEGYEADVFVPQLNMAIEIDGNYWHADKVEYDKEKQKHFETNKIICFRLRQEGLPFISSRCVSWKGGNFFEETKILFSKIGEEINEPSIINYSSLSEPLNPELFNEVTSRLPAPVYEDSLEALEPELCLEWDHEENGFLKPRMFSKGSDQKVFWKCKVCDHKWDATIKNRAGTRRSGCPICAMEKSRTPKRNCQICGELFKPSSKQKYCSKKCADEAQRKPKVKNKCKICSTTFYSYPNEGKRKYCSKKCYHASKDVSKEAVCEHCKKVFLNRSSRSQKYCSYDCRKAGMDVSNEVTCGHCGKVFLNRSSRLRKYCSSKCGYADR
tara:strand:+ start:1768 stop:3504 length:1737 start_codon:yes stop_codon:yes gene_type:complete